MYSLCQSIDQGGKRHPARIHQTLLASGKHLWICFQRLKSLFLFCPGQNPANQPKNTKKAIRVSRSGCPIVNSKRCPNANRIGKAGGVHQIPSMGIFPCRIHLGLSIKFIKIPHPMGVPPNDPVGFSMTIQP